MQQNNAVNVEERFGRAVEEVQNILAEHARLCAERVAAAEETAQGDRARFAEASGELAQARRDLSALSAERDRLPFEAYTASMDGESDRESELRARYQEIEPGHLEALRRSCGDLEAEKNALGGTASAAEKRALKNVRGVYASVLQSLQEFEGRTDGLKAAVGESRSKYWNGQRGVEEQLSFLRGIEQGERREARAEAAKREEEARRAVTGTRGKVIG